MDPATIALLAAAAGGTLGAFGGGRGPKKVSRFDKQQRDFFSQLGDAFSGQGQFADLLAPFDEQAARSRFEQSVAQPAIQQFQEQIVPGITGQFRGKNLGESSFLGANLSKSGSDLESRLAALLQQDLFAGREKGLDRRLGALQNFLQTQTFDLQDQGPGLFDRILSGAGLGLKAGAGFGGFGGSSDSRSISGGRGATTSTAGTGTFRPTSVGATRR